MKRLLLTFAALTTALSLIASALATNHSITAGVKVAVASSGLGADPRRRTRPHPLPLHEGQARQKRLRRAMRCFWPPLIASGKPVATAGVKATLLGTTKRADGRLQVTYNHHPLYSSSRTRRRDRRTARRSTPTVRVVRALARGRQGREERRQESSGNSGGPRRAVTATATRLAHTPTKRPLWPDRRVVQIPVTRTRPKNEQSLGARKVGRPALAASPHRRPATRPYRLDHREGGGCPVSRACACVGRGMGGVQSSLAG